MRTLVLILGLAAVSTSFTLEDHDHERFRRQVPLTRALTYPHGAQKTVDGVPILPGAYNRRSRVTTDGSDGLSLYEDFVNDPWKPTEELGPLLSERQRQGQAQGARELRSGYESTGNRDRVWSSRSGQMTHEGLRSRGPAPVTSSRPTDPVYGNEGNQFWSVSSRSGDHITYTRRGSSTNAAAGATNTNAQHSRAAPGGGSQSWRQPGQRNSGAIRSEVSRVPNANWRINSARNQAEGQSSNIESGSSSMYGSSSHSNAGQPYDFADGTWVVASRSDDHITYTKRVQGAQTGESDGIQQLGQGEGQVLARVVNTGNSDEEEPSGSRGHQQRRSQAGRTQGQGQLASYKTMRSRYAHNEGEEGQDSGKPHLSLKSGDFVSYRGQDGNEMVYPRHRDGSGRSGSSSHYRRHESRVVVHPTGRPETREVERTEIVHPTGASAQQGFEQQGDWRVVSKDNSHITWTRVGSDFERNPPSTGSNRQMQNYRQNESSRRTEVRSGGPHYPMMLEKETAERASRLGTHNTMHIAY